MYKLQNVHKDIVVLVSACFKIHTGEQWIPLSYPTQVINYHQYVGKHEPAKHIVIPILDFDNLNSNTLHPDSKDGLYK